MVLEVDARGFTIPGTERAVVALVSVNLYAQPRESGQEREQRTHRTDGVAIGASSPPSQHYEQHQRCYGNDEHRQRLQPYVD